MRNLISLSIISCFLALSGCHDVYLSDDIDLVLDFSWLKGPSDTLHSPYVQGAQVTLYGNSSDEDRDTSGWRLESSDPNVMRIISQSGGKAECLAVKAGLATIRVYERSGDVDPIHSAMVDVRKPTRADLFAHGPLLLGRSTVEARTPRPTIINDGTATFLVRYYAGNVPLSGNGVLDATATSSVELGEEETYLFEHQEWLRITPRAPGLHKVMLSAAGVPVGSVEVRSVTTSEISYIKLQGQNEGRADDGEWLVVLARALTASSVDVFGVEYGWKLDGAQKAGSGDLFRYEHAKDSPKELRASHTGLDSLVTINASQGYVDSSNEVGCSTVPGLPAGSPALPVALITLIGATLAGRRMRR